MREKILKILEDEIYDFYDRAQARQYQSKNVSVSDPHKTRQNYAKVLVQLIHEYNLTLKDIELDEIKRELADLKRSFATNKNRGK